MHRGITQARSSMTINRRKGGSVTYSTYREDEVIGKMLLPSVLCLTGSRTFFFLPAKRLEICYGP